jgi:polyphosphate kinase 2 (PPK2 family)
VLVERVEKFAEKEEWKRAYGEINEFERTLVDDGAVLLKFYIHISKGEQLKRFKKRESDPYKRWKMNDEDWRNRDKWPLYLEAAEEMFDKTDTSEARWNLIEGEHKWHARLKTLRVIIARFEKEFGKL